MRRLNLGGRVVASVVCLTSARKAASQAAHPVAAFTEEDRRPSRRRFSAFNRVGRSQRVKELITSLKQQDAETAKRSFEMLPPRERLDIMRALHSKRRKRRQDRSTPRLPRYWSSTFERHYYFKEEDMTEESTLGRGPGGQATNRRMQTVILQHKPTGLIVKFSRFPSLWLNRRAARELMSLRLEERLLGPESLLGRKKAARERRKAQRGRVIKYLTKKGRKIEARHSEQRDVHAFLRNTAPLPAGAAVQLGARLAGKPVFLKSLFDEECQNLWPILTHAFVEANRDVLPPKGAQRAIPAPYQLPLIFYFMFPMAEQPDITAAAREQLELCANDPVARENVKQGFQCFAELFGLRVLQQKPGSPAGSLRLARDGINFVQYQDRLVEKDASALAPFASAAFPHVYASLLTLDLRPEALSLVRFFRREHRLSTSKEGAACQWASHGVQLLAAVPRRRVGDEACALA